VRGSRRNKIHTRGNPAIVRSIPAVFPQHSYLHPGLHGIPTVPIPVHTSSWDDTGSERRTACSVLFQMSILVVVSKGMRAVKLLRRNPPVFLKLDLVMAMKHCSSSSSSSRSSIRHNISQVHWVNGLKVTERKFFNDMDTFCVIKAEFKLRRRVQHLRSDSEKVVLIKHWLLSWYPLCRGWTGTMFGSVCCVDWNP